MKMLCVEITIFTKHLIAHSFESSNSPHGLMWIFSCSFVLDANVIHVYNRFYLPYT